MLTLLSHVPNKIMFEIALLGQSHHSEIDIITCELPAPSAHLSLLGSQATTK